MSLIINGIDFDKRLNDAKRLLHDSIDWRAQCEGLAVYFNVKVIERSDKKLESFKEIITRLKQAPLTPFITEDIRQQQIEEYKKAMENYLLYNCPGPTFELKRIK